MKHFLSLLSSVTTIATLSFSVPSQSAPSQSAPSQPATTIPTVRISSNRTQLELQWSGRTTTINANSFKAQVLDGVDCAKGQIAPRQNLAGQSFFGSRALSIDPLTGNVAIGVVMQDCFDSFTSAVFVIDPQTPGAYSLSVVPVPGVRTLPDASATFPLNAIERVRYLDGDLLIRNGSTAVSSRALLVFTPSTTPAGKYAGCVVTQQDEGFSLCPRQS